MLFLIIAQNLSPLFPVGGMTSIDHDQLSFLGKILDIGWHMILPTIALSITSFAGLQRLTRGQLLDVLQQDYIQTARAKGLPENQVIYIHALRNAINPLVTLIGFEFATLFSTSGGAGLIDFNLDSVKQAYDQAYEKGKSYVSDLEEKEDSAADVYQTLEKLGKLKEQGILSDEEFETKKKELLSRI